MLNQFYKYIKILQINLFITPLIKMTQALLIINMLKDTSLRFLQIMKHQANLNYTSLHQI